MLESLFSSRTRTQILTVLLMSPDSAFNALELSQKLGVSYSLVWNELARLEKIKLLTSSQKGRARYYQADPSNPIAPELRSMIIKTEGIGNAIREALGQEKGVKAVFIFGSFAANEVDERSDVDIMVIGEIELPRFAEAISKLEMKLSRPINYVILTGQEWKKRLTEGDAFITNVNSAPKIMLIGGEDAL